MLKIRLARYGGNNKPAYKIVVAPARSPRSRALAFLGYYDPAHNPPKFQIDKDKYDHWIKEGAQPTTAVVKLVEGSYEYVKYEQNQETGEGGKDGEKEAAPEKKEAKAKGAETKEPAKERADEGTQVSEEQPA